MQNPGLLSTALLLSTTLCLGCTATVDSDQVRKGNHSAPDKYKVSEDCESANGEECKVVISYPDSKKDGPSK